MWTEASLHPDHRGGYGGGVVRFEARSLGRNRPTLGGWLPGIEFTEQQRRTLGAIADRIIPEGDGFPAPSTVDVVAFFARYVAPAGVEPKWYPLVGEVEFTDRLDALAPALAGTDAAGEISALRGLEAEDPGFFGVLRDMTYFAYYSRPAVVAAINANLAAGRDLRPSPQPYGYSDALEDWDPQLFSAISGGYTRTDEVRRVPLPGWLSDSSDHHSQEG